MLFKGATIKAKPSNSADILYIIPIEPKGNRFKLPFYTYKITPIFTLDNDKRLKILTSRTVAFFKIVTQGGVTIFFLPIKKAPNLGGSNNYPGINK